MKTHDTKPENPQCVSVGGAFLLSRITLETLDDRLKQILVLFLGAMLWFLCHQPLKSVITGLQEVLCSALHTQTHTHTLHVTIFIKVTVQTWEIVNVLFTWAIIYLGHSH